MALIGGGILVTNGAIRWMDLNLVYRCHPDLIGLFLLVYRGSPYKID